MTPPHDGQGERKGGMAEPMPSERFCLHCQKYGHYTDDCPTPAEVDQLREALLKIADWVERDRREPDKMLLHAASMRRAVLYASPVVFRGDE